MTNAGRFTLFVLAIAMALGCSGPAADADANPNGGDGGGTTAVAGGNMITLTTRGLAVIHGATNVDQTVNLARTADQNAMTFRDNAVAGVGPCANAMISGTTVTLGFVNCMLKNHMVVNGGLTLDVSATAGGITVVATFAQLAVDGRTLDGTITFAFTSAATVATAVALTSASKTITGNLTGTYETTSITFDGTLSENAAGDTTTATLAGLVYSQPDCYPSGGKLTVVHGAVTVVITFDAATATTGTAAATIDGHATTAKLPAYGACGTP